MTDRLKMLERFQQIAIRERRKCESPRAIDFWDSFATSIAGRIAHEHQRIALQATK